MNDHSPDAVPHIPPLDPDRIRSVLQDVHLEIQRQDELARAGKFGGLHSLPAGPDDARLRVLVEEVGEAAKELNEVAILRSRKEATEFGLSGKQTNLYKELLQVAASAAAWATALREGR